MWKIFGKINNSIAIKTQVKYLKKIYDNKVESDCYLAKVEYFKPDDNIAFYNKLLLFMRKPVFFDYEKEIRGIIQWDSSYDYEKKIYPKNE
jgi:hypothetical protein